MTIKQFTEFGQLECMRKRPYSLSLLYEEFSGRPLTPNMPADLAINALAGLYHRIQKQQRSLWAALYAVVETDSLPKRRCPSVEALFYEIFRCSFKTHDLSESDAMRLICLALRRAQDELKILNVALKKQQQSSQIVLF